MKRHVTRYSREQLDQAIERNTDPIACYYLQAELNRRGNNGRKAKEKEMTNWLTESNAAEGQIVEISGDKAKIIRVIPNLGIVINTLGAGMKLRITYQFAELSLRGAKIVELV